MFSGQWFEYMDPELKVSLERARTMQLKCGDILFRYGDQCSGFVIVLDGFVRVVRIDAEGKEIVLYRVSKGQSCMLTTICLMGDQPYPAEGVAESDVELMLLSAAEFERLLLSSRVFRRFVLGHMAQRITDLMLLVEDIAFTRMDRRLAQLLLRLQHQGVLMVTHQELARELGTAREVVSRLLKSFEANGWLQLQRGRIDIINEMPLQHLVEH